MSSFTKATGFTPIPLTDQWLTTDSFTWYVARSSKTITVPSLYKFNGADIPPPVSFVWPRVHPDYMQAACLHDYMLDNLVYQYSRDFADRQFYEALLALGNSQVKSWLMYQAVKAYGLFIEGSHYYG